LSQKENTIVIFEKNKPFHIYNQGNNRGRIYFNERNYQFFLFKVEKYIQPYADIIAWCLMPNHFHLMVHIRNTERYILKGEMLEKKSARSLNDSIGILLRTYTRAVNKENNWSGSLFRNGTKAVPIDSLKSLMPTLAITQNTLLLKSILSEKQYPQICFNYIHLNPVRAKLVKNLLEWKYSSAQDFYGRRKSKLTNVEVAKKFVDIDLAFDLNEPLT